MKKYIIGQLVIAAHQCLQFGGKEHEQLFEASLKQLQKATGTSREQAVDLVVAELSL